MVLELIKNRKPYDEKYQRETFFLTVALISAQHKHEKENIFKWNLLHP